MLTRGCAYTPSFGFGVGGVGFGVGVGVGGVGVGVGAGSARAGRLVGCMGLYAAACTAAYTALGAGVAVAALSLCSLYACASFLSFPSVCLHPALESALASPIPLMRVGARLT